VGIAFVRKSWATLGVGLALALCLSGCQELFPRPAYTPPPAPTGPAYPKPRRAQIARPTFYVAVKDHLNLRACPGMDCPKISVLNRNEEVEELGTAGDWSQVRVKSTGSIGGVYSRYLSANPLPALPPVTAPAPQVAPPPLPEIPETVKPAPAKPAVETPPSRPAEGAPAEIKRKPEEARPVKPAPPKKVVAPAPAKPVKPEQPVKPEKPTQVEKPPKPAPVPPVEKPTPPAPEPSPEKPSSIRIM
jgi:hypothetical protein